MGAACGGGSCRCPVVKKPELPGRWDEAPPENFDDALHGLGQGSSLNLDCVAFACIARGRDRNDVSRQAYDIADFAHREEVHDRWPKHPPASAAGSDEGDSDGEEGGEEPERFLRPRGLGVCSEPIHKGYYKDPYWNKHNTWENRLFSALSACVVFRQFAVPEIRKFVQAMEIHLRYTDEVIAEEGEAADGLYIVLQGTVTCWSGEEYAPFDEYGEGEVIDEHAVLWNSPRTFTMKADGDCTVAKLCRKDYVNLCSRHAYYRREFRQQLLRSAKLLEMMDDESLTKLCDVLHVRTYEEGKQIITQGEPGQELFILTSGEASVTVRTADDEQEHNRYKPGSLFGEVALLTKQPRAATVTAVHGPAEVLVLHRRQFERLFGEMAQLQAQQYLRDPRKLIADFYDRSDTRGPRGTLRMRDLEPDPRLPETTWFAVFRPTSKEAIAKMLSGSAVGKGLNVKGKSAKQGILSGFVPFVQISDNKHKQLIENSPAGARLKVYYRTKVARKEAMRTLESIMQDASPSLDIGERSVWVDESYDGREAFGLDIPEPLLREAYIMKQDLSPVMGWETGRRSEPAFMDANLHAIRDVSEPKVVLYQIDETDTMNPRGLLIAYAEKFVKPVVSDFDTFLVGSRGMQYDPLPLDQAKLVIWMLDHTAQILKTADHNSWTSRWLEVLKRESEKGFHPSVPKMGFGDPTSYRLTEDVVAETSPCGAIRHGAECCNFYFPQELDDEYLIVWHGCPDKPWAYKSEADMRKFLLERVQEGFSFPLNPVWPVRDPGWHDVLSALRRSAEGSAPLAAWFPAEAGILDKIEEIHAKHPEGFKAIQQT